MAKLDKEVLERELDKEVLERENRRVTVLRTLCDYAEETEPVGSVTRLFKDVDECFGFKCITTQPIVYSYLKGETLTEDISLSQRVIKAVRKHQAFEKADSSVSRAAGRLKAYLNGSRAEGPSYVFDDTARYIERLLKGYQTVYDEREELLAKLADMEEARETMQKRTVELQGMIEDLTEENARLRSFAEDTVQGNAEKRLARFVEKLIPNSPAKQR